MNISTYTQREFETIIVGGGITGIGIFRDLCMHHTNTLILERGKFMSQTSSRSSKLLHGGIRYLETLDFPLIKMALEEKNLWKKLTPEICTERPFHLLNYKNSKHSKFFIKLGLEFYDFLSGFSNSSNYMLSKKKTLELFPQLNSSDLQGACVYYDVVMNDALLGNACLQDTLKNYQPYAHSKQFFKVNSVKREGQLWKVTGENVIQQSTESFFAKYIILCAGPFTDQVMQSWNINPKFPWKNIMRPSRGAHFWLDFHQLPISNPIVLNTLDNRILFVVPHEKKILIGTTEFPNQDKFSQELFNPCAHKAELQYLIHQLTLFFPSLTLSEKDILDPFVGFRPLVNLHQNPENKNTFSSSQLSRDHEILRPYKNFFILAGGKYTTFRVMGQEITRIIVESKNKIYNPNKTKKKLLY